MKKQASIVLLATFAMVILPSISIGQVEYGGDTVPGAHAITFGLEARYSMRDASFSYEWLLGKRLVPNLSVGTGLNKLSFNRRRSEGGLLWRYAGSLQFKYFFALNKKHPLGGFYSILHFGYHRLGFRYENQDYLNYRSYRSEVGPGLGFQWVLFDRIMVGTSGIICWAKGEEWRGNPDGTTAWTMRRSGFLAIRNIRVGISF